MLFIKNLFTLLLGTVNEKYIAFGLTISQFLYTEYKILNKSTFKNKTKVKQGFR